MTPLGQGPTRVAGDDATSPPLGALIAESTVSRDRSYLDSLILPTFGTTGVGDITTGDIEHWIRGLDRVPATIN